MTNYFFRPSFRCLYVEGFSIVSKHIILIIVAAATTIFFSGCSRHLTINFEGISSVDVIHGGSQVHQYLGLPDQDIKNGPFHVIYFSTKSDLEGMAKEYTHHLYFSLIPCSQSDHGYALWSGGVFRVSVELDRFDKMQGSPQPKALYSIHVPKKSDAIIRFVKGFGALNADQYLKTAVNDNLCVRVGGAQMWPVSLLSNNLKVPFSFATDSGISEVK